MGWEMVSSYWISINSCLVAVDLCARHFSSYCLGVLVGTLPAPAAMPGSHHHPSHSDQRQRGYLPNRGPYSKGGYKNTGGDAALVAPAENRLLVPQGKGGLARAKTMPREGA